jgi:hypothetical protein
MLSIEAMIITENLIKVTLKLHILLIYVNGSYLDLHMTAVE